MNQIITTFFYMFFYINISIYAQDQALKTSVVDIDVSSSNSINNSIKKTIYLKNNLVKFTPVIKQGQLYSENLSFTNDTITETIHTNGDFSFSIVWTDWLPPGKHNNGENPILLTKKDFEFDSYTVKTLTNQTKLIRTLYHGINHHLQLAITYQIQPDKYYIKRKVAIRDTLYNKHFLQKINALQSTLHQPKTFQLEKKGGFGQPGAFSFNNKGFFFGLEYPASTNKVKTNKKEVTLCSFQQIGKKYLTTG